MTRARDLADSADKDISGTLTVDDLTASGEALIGTSTSPSSSDVKLAINSSGGGFAQFNFNGGAGSAIGSPAASTQAFYTTTGNIGSDVYTERMRITSGGYIEAASASQVRLTLGSQGTAGTNDANWIRGNGTSLGFNSASGGFQWEIGGSEKMRIDSSSRLLVGKTSADGGVAGAELRPAGTILGTASGDYPLYLNRLSTDGTIAQFRKDSTLVGSIASRSGATLSFVGNPSSGNGAGVAASTNMIIPSSETGAAQDDRIDLGSTSTRWQDLYLSGGVHIGGTGSSNKLEDYEEGTWTPYLARWSGGNISATYTQQTGRYTKIGRMVTLSFDITVSAISSQGTSLIYISGSPFNNPSTQDYEFAGTFGVRDAISSSTVATSCIKHATNSAILIRQNNNFNENVDDNWQVGSMRGSITFEVA